MEDKIYEAIASWAGIPTWYTSHPLDDGRFNEAMAELVSTVGCDIQRSQFEAALTRHATGNPAILGSPSDWSELVSEFTDKAMAIIEYESAN